MDAWTVRVLGASGGVGVSTLAVALAVLGAGSGRRSVVLESDVHGALDVTACVEHQPGLRWGDLTGLRGGVEGAALWRDLPEVGGARLLSGGSTGVAGAGPPGVPDPPTPELAAAVAAALTEVADLVVVDGGRGPAPGPVGGDDGVVDLLVTATTARGGADAVGVAEQWTGAPPWLVVRGRTELAEGLAHHLDLPLAGAWPDDARVRADADRARTPGTGRGRLVALAERVLRRLEPGPLPVRQAS